MTRLPRIRVWPVAARGRPHRLLRLGLISALLSILLALVSILWLKQPVTNSEKTTIANLSQARRQIHHDFSGLLELLQKRQAQLTANPWPEDPRTRFEFFKSRGLNTALEGLASLDGQLNLEIWYGNVANLKALLPEAEKVLPPLLDGSFVVQDRASTYLISLKPAGQTGYLAVFELLAFQPQFQSTYLRQYLRLKSVSQTGADIDFWEYSHDTEALDRLFERNQDTYLSQQREEQESRTLYFPLRNEKGQILATVTLNSFRLAGQKLSLNQAVSLLAIILGSLALTFFLFWLIQGRSRSFWSSKLIDWLFGSAAIIGLRSLLAILVSQKPFSDWPVFSPQEAAFRTVKNLTASAGDIFLTYLFIFLLAVLSLKSLKPGVSLACWLQPSKSAKNKIEAWQAVAGAFLLVLGFQAFIWSLKQLAGCTSFNLLQYNFSLASLLIYLSLFLAALSFIFLPLLILRRIFLASSARKISLLTGLTAILIFGLLAWLVMKPAGLNPVWQLIFLWSLALVSASVKRRTGYVFLSLFLIALVQFSAIRNLTTARTRQLTEDVLVHLVSSQKTWAEMALKQSLLELQRENRDIHFFFRHPGDGDFARSLWNKTFLARLNWNSCLYLQSSDRKLLSSFSLNMPVFAEQTDDLEISVEPVYAEQDLEILGQERHFLIGYQDFTTDSGSAGRLVIWVSLDPTLLPFINTANPYFELLRLNTLPSLRHFPVYLAIFDQGGQLLFHQTQPAFSLEPQLRQKLKDQPSGLWTILQANGQSYQAYCLTLEDGQVYAFYQPPESARRLITGFLKLLFLIDFTSGRQKKRMASGPPVFLSQSLSGLFYGGSGSSLFLYLFYSDYGRKNIC